jgi:hypothetical protein
MAASSRSSIVSERILLLHAGIILVGGRLELLVSSLQSETRSTLLKRDKKPRDCFEKSSQQCCDAVWFPGRRAF